MTHSFKEQAAAAAQEGRILGTKAAYLLPFAVSMMASTAFAQNGNPPAPNNDLGNLTTTLNTELQGALTTGRNAGTQLACTGIMVFLDNAFVQFVFGLILLVTIIGLAYAYYQNQRGGGGFSRLFFLIVGGMAVVALAGTLANNFLDCDGANGVGGGGNQQQNN